MYSRFWRLALVGALLCGLCGSASAQTAADDGCLRDVTCRDHYEKAVQFFEAGRFDAALPEFQAAYATRQMPWLLINMGRTLHRLGRPREALEHYDRYRAAESKPDPETAERLEKYIAQSKALADAPGATVQAQPASPSPNPAPAASTSDTPIYKKWWFWTAIGGGVVLVTAVGIGVGVAASGSGTPMPMPMPSMLPTGVVVYRPNFP